MSHTASLRAAVALVLFALVVILASCGVLDEEPTTATVRVEAPEKLCWTGAIGDATRDGCGSASFEVDGIGGIFSANAQKMDGSASPLTVTLVVDGEEVDRTTTTAAFGVAQVSGP